MRKFLTRRTIIPLFLAFFVLLFLIFLMFSGRHENHRVNGNEWFLEQRPYFEKLRSFVSTMDEVYTLYISEVMEVDTFKLEHSILTKELQSINDEYYANKAHIKIAPGTFSTDARNGISALEGLGEFERVNKPKACRFAKGVRTSVPCCHLIQEYRYAYGAVNPQDESNFFLYMLYYNKDCMNVFPQELL